LGLPDDIGELLAELEPPLPDRLVADLDAAEGQHLLDHPKAESLKMYLFPVSARQTWLQRHCLGPVLAATLKPGWSDVGRVEGQGARQQCRMIAVLE
jgi:hypothetical protein